MCASVASAKERKVSFSYSERKSPSVIPQNQTLRDHATFPLPEVSVGIAVSNRGSGRGLRFVSMMYWTLCLL